MLITELDRAGYLELDGLTPAEAVAVHVEMPIEIVQVGVDRLIHRGVLIVVGDRLFAPNYVEAQTTSKSENQRKREQREREAAERAEAKRGAAVIVTMRDPKSRPVTNGAENHSAGGRLEEPEPKILTSGAQNGDVTGGDAMPSRLVTDGHGSGQKVTLGHNSSRNVTLSLIPDPDPKEEEICPPDGGQSGSARPNTDRAPLEIFQHWVSAMGKPSTTKLTQQRRAKVKARLRDGYTVEQLKRAVDGCKRSPFHMGENDRGQPYNDLETILRSGKTVEEHIARLGSAERPPAKREPVPQHLKELP